MLGLERWPVPGTGGLASASGLDVSAACREIGVTRIADLTGLDIIGLPVAQAVRPGSRSLSVSMGKGASIEAAKLSAFGEAFELHCAESFGGGDILPAVAVFSGRRSEFDGGAVSFDLTSSCNAQASATGLGAHPDIGLAIQHGLQECLERHFYSLWFRSNDGQKLTGRLDTRGLAEAAGGDLLRHLESLGFEVLVWNIAPGSPAPAFMAEIVAPPGIAGNLVDYSQGIACHVDSDVALTKALHEAVQTRMAYISGAREDLSAYDYFGRLRETADNRLGLIRNRRPANSYTRRPCPPGEEATRLRAAVEALGFEEPVYADLTPAGSTMRAVKVMAPGTLDDLGAEEGHSCQLH